jgi:hypothetical protein
MAAAVATAQQEQQQDEDVIMVDAPADEHAAGTALQPLNHRATGAARTATAGKGAQQRQQHKGAAAAASAAGQGAAQQQQQQQQLVLPAQMMQDVMLQLLDCFSFGMDGAFGFLQQQRSWQRSLPAVVYAISSSAKGGSISISSDSSAQAAQSWGVFELQRRCCAVMAGLLHTRQEALLLYALDPQVASGAQGCA